MRILTAAACLILAGMPAAGCGPFVNLQSANASVGGPYTAQPVGAEFFISFGAGCTSRSRYEIDACTGDGSGVGTTLQFDPPGILEVVETRANGASVRAVAEGITTVTASGTIDGSRESASRDFMVGNIDEVEATGCKLVRSGGRERIIGRAHSRLFEADLEIPEERPLIALAEPIEGVTLELSSADRESNERPVQRYFLEIAEGFNGPISLVSPERSDFSDSVYVFEEAEIDSVTVELVRIYNPEKVELDVVAYIQGEPIECAKADVTIRSLTPEICHFTVNLEPAETPLTEYTGTQSKRSVYALEPGECQIEVESAVSGQTAFVSFPMPFEGQL